MGAAQPKPEAAEGEDDYQHIDTGDSLKVKQILDEATVKAVEVPPPPVEGTPNPVRAEGQMI